VRHAHHVAGRVGGRVEPAPEGVLDRVHRLAHRQQAGNVRTGNPARAHGLPKLHSWLGSPVQGNWTAPPSCPDTVRDLPLLTLTSAYASPVGSTCQCWLAEPLQVHCSTIAPSSFDSPFTSRHFPDARLVSVYVSASPVGAGVHFWLGAPEQ